MRLLFLLIPFFVMIPVYADSDYTPYQNSQFGYSISVPSGWIIDDQPFTSENGDYTRLTSTAAIYDKQDWDHYIEVSFEKMTISSQTIQEKNTLSRSTQSLWIAAMMLHLNLTDTDATIMQCWATK